jgi:hypothetical protein
MLNAAARRAVLAAPAPDGTLHDWWCYLVVTGIGGRVIFEPEPVLLYRQHAANAVGAAAASGTRARRALQRGPGPFLARLAAHLRALAALPGLTPQAAVAVEALGALRHAGPIGRLRALRCAGVYRQGGLEDALLRLWVAARPLP